MITIMLAEDHQVMRAGIRSLLEKEVDFQIIHEASSGLEVLSILKQKSKNPDIILTDINMAEIDGLALTKIIKTEYPDIRIIILSMFDSYKYVVDAFDCGASAYLMKNVDKSELVFSIRHVYFGNQFICSELGIQMLRKIKRQITRHPEDLPIVDFSVRELEILNLIADGLTNEEIAEQLFTSKRTVEGQRKNLIDKAGVTNTAALIQYAFRSEIIK